MTPRLLSLCVCLAIGPPVALLAYHHQDLFKEGPPIDPRLVDGQLIVFTSNGCGACQRMKPVVSELSREGFDVRTYDVSSNQQKAERYGIRSIPTFVLVRGGKEVRRQSGGMSVEQLREMWR